MAKSQRVPENSIGSSREILKNSIGTLKGQLGTIGGNSVSVPKQAKKKS